MPELPEVETVRLQLAGVLPTQTIAHISVKRPTSFKGDHSVLVGKTILSVRRYSKLLIIDFSDNFSVAVHLKMTGRLVFQPSAAGGRRPAVTWDINYPSDRHTHITFQFDSGDQLFFHDQRTFGYIQVVKTTQVEELSYIKTLGPEFFRNLTMKEFATVLKKSQRPVKTVLLDQHTVGGIGNIYANEGLWMAQIHPETPAAFLPSIQANRLFASLSEIMTKAIAWGGASNDDYRDAFGQRGTVQDHLSVYGRKGQPCLRCGHPIKKYALAGRGTYVCEQCQKNYSEVIRRKGL